MPRAALHLRIIAWIIDQSALCLIPLAALLANLGPKSTNSIVLTQPQVGRWIVADYLLATNFCWRIWSLRPAILWIAVAYWAIEVVTGRTPGKRLMGLRVMRVDAAPCSWARRLLRCSLKCAPLVAAIIAASFQRWLPARTIYWSIVVCGLWGGVLMVFGFIAAWWPPFQTVHDRVAGTNVFHATARPQRGFLVECREPQ